MSSMGKGQELLLSQIREAYGRVAYTHKTHEKQADLYFQKQHRQQGVLIALTVISSGTFLASLGSVVFNQAWTSMVTSFIGILVSAVSLSIKAFKYGELAQKHRDTAAKIWDLRESYQSLIVDIQSRSITSHEGQVRRDNLQKATYAIYAAAPRTTKKAYSLAQKALQDKEDLTFSDQEINMLLPTNLRISRKNDDD